MTPQADEPLLARLSLTDASGRRVALNDYWLPGKTQFRAFSATDREPVKVALSALAGGRVNVRVINTGKAVAGAVKLQLIERATNTRVLPAYFSDGWFNLLPGESRDVVLDGWKEGVALEACSVKAVCEW